MPTYLVTGQGVKSIPLNSLPEDAWRYLVGSGVDGGGANIFDLYESIPWLYRGVEARCNALSGMPVSIHKGNESGKEIDPNTLPFMMEPLPLLLNRMYRWYILLGKSYVYTGRLTERSSIREVRAMHPDTIEPKVNPSEGFVGFIRRIGTTQIPLTTYELHPVFKMSARKELGAGVADAATALRAAGVLNSLDEMEQRLYTNGAINPTLLTMPAGTQQADKERLRSWYRRVLTGVKKAFAIEVVEGPKPEVVTLGHRPKDLAAPEITAQKREDIATALGVPQTLMFSNAANYATARQDDLHFYDKTIRPDAQMFADVLNAVVFQPMGFFMKFHPERMELYQQLEAEKATAVISLYEAGLMEYEEAREHMNLSPRPINAAGEEIHVSPESRTHVLGYHIEQGVVSKNEARAVLGLTPVDDSAGERLRNLASQLSLLQAATAAGIPFEAAAVMIGLDIPKVATPSVNNPPADSAAPGKAFLDELKKWERMAGKRWQEGRPQKALDFTSEVIPASLAAAIRGQLSAVQSAAHLPAVFKNAAQFEAYP